LFYVLLEQVHLDPNQLMLVGNWNKTKTKKNWKHNNRPSPIWWHCRGKRLWLPAPLESLTAPAK